MDIRQPGESQISFSEEDLALFSRASGDHNPLHLSPQYARLTPYGEPVVFGCLGAIACLGRLKFPEGWGIVSLQAEFLRPMFLGVAYQFAITEKDGECTAQLLDGSLPVVSLTAKAIAGAAAASTAMSSAARVEREKAAIWKTPEIEPGLEASGLYSCDPAALGVLVRRWGGVDPFLAAALCWSSYVIGMEIPGEAALFSKVVLSFNRTSQPSSPAEYRASVVSVDSRFGRAKIDVSLSNEGGTIASGSCWAFVRPELPEFEETESDAAKPGPLAGRVVVLIGGSRGLGAAMKRALDVRGAIVYSLSRSATADPRTETGDASDPAALNRLRERILKEQGRLDILICNAFPPLLPLRLEPNGAPRIGAYINLAVALTLTPLCLFLDLLNTSGGCAVIISSKTIEQPVREWPHYIAAKQAVESLCQIAVLQYPQVRALIFRPPKLLTTLTNTPGGRRGAASPTTFANRVIARLEERIESGRAEILS